VLGAGTDTTQLAMWDGRTLVLQRPPCARAASGGGGEIAGPMPRPAARTEGQQHNCRDGGRVDLPERLGAILPTTPAAAAGPRLCCRCSHGHASCLPRRSGRSRSIQHSALTTGSRRRTDRSLHWR